VRNSKRRKKTAKEDKINVLGYISLKHARLLAIVGAKILNSIAD